MDKSKQYTDQLPRDPDPPFEIRFEQYVFGHTGGMDEIGRSPSLSDQDLTFLYDAIEIYQGPLVWKNDSYGLTCCTLPSGKILVTAVFPDADQGGRSTIFGHCLILSKTDFEKIHYNPFFLVEKNLFSREKKRPKHLDKIKMSCTPRETIDAFNRLGRRIADFPDFSTILDMVINHRKVFFCTDLPANHLVQSILYGMPTAARANFSFSTIEPEIHEPGPGSRQNTRYPRNIVFTAVPLQCASAAANLKKATACLLKGNTLKPLANAPTRPSLSSYARTFEQLIQRQKPMYQVYETVEKGVGIQAYYDTFEEYMRFRYLGKNTLSEKTLEELKKHLPETKFEDQVLTQLCEAVKIDAASQGLTKLPGFITSDNFAEHPVVIQLHQDLLYSDLPREIHKQIIDFYCRDTYQKQIRLGRLNPENLHDHIVEEILSTLTGQTAHQLNNALIITRAWGLTHGFKIVQNNTRFLETHSDQDAFFRFLAECEKHYQSMSYPQIDALKKWIKQNVDSSGLKKFNPREQQLLEFFNPPPYKQPHRETYHHVRKQKTDFSKNAAENSINDNATSRAGKKPAGDTQTRKTKQRSFYKYPLIGTLCVVMFLVIAAVFWDLTRLSSLYTQVVHRITGTSPVPREPAPVSTPVSLFIQSTNNEKPLPGLEILLYDVHNRTQSSYRPEQKLLPGQYIAVIGAQNHHIKIIPFTLESGKSIKNLSYDLEKKSITKAPPKTTVEKEAKPQPQIEQTNQATSLEEEPANQQMPKSQP